jgi:hypothetical protein
MVGDSRQQGRQLLSLRFGQRCQQFVLMPPCHTANIVQRQSSFGRQLKRVAATIRSTTEYTKLTESAWRLVVKHRETILALALELAHFMKANDRFPYLRNARKRGSVNEGRR